MFFHILLLKTAQMILVKQS
ncbi:hypothetical protein [Winogradskyella sp. A3E31]